jgi:hypothetical protein
MWNSMLNELNELHTRLEQKPDSEKMGYACCPGGILNAYREADITFAQAVKAIEDWALSQGAKNTEQQLQADSPVGPTA